MMPVAVLLGLTNGRQPHLMLQMLRHGNRQNRLVVSDWLAFETSPLRLLGLLFLGSLFGASWTQVGHRATSEKCHTYGHSLEARSGCLRSAARQFSCRGNRSAPYHDMLAPWARFLATLRCQK